MSQSKRMSFVEQIISTAFGFAISLCIQFYLMIFMGKEFSHAENVFVISVYTVASLARGYFVRRFFNWYHVRDSGYGINKIHDATEFYNSIEGRHKMRVMAAALNDSFDNLKEDLAETNFTPNALMRMATLDNVKLYPQKKWNESTQRWDDNPEYWKQLELESQK